MTYLQPNMEETAIRQGLAQEGYTGTGTMTKDDPRIMADSYTYQSQVSPDDAINLPGPGAMPIHSPVGGSGTIARFLDEVNLPDRTVNFQCLGGYSRENYSIQLPQRPRGDGDAEGHPD